MKAASLHSLLLIITASIITHPSNAFAASPSTSSMELKYFDGRGAAETSRIILALADEQYKDTRYKLAPGTFDAPEFKAAKENNELDINLGRAPILITDNGSVIGQSKAIERYLCKKFGFMGSTEIEEAQIDCIAEHCRDVKDAAMRKGFSMFNKEKSDEEKAEARKEWFEVDMPLMLGNIEKAIGVTGGESGYAVGKSNSYADISIFSLLKDCTTQSDAEDTLNAAEKCEKLMAIADRIASDDKVSKWVESRPTTMF